jgi:hypothetical protein
MPVLNDLRSYGSGDPAEPDNRGDAQRHAGDLIFGRARRRQTSGDPIAARAPTRTSTAVRLGIKGPVRRRAESQPGLIAGDHPRSGELVLSVAILDAGTGPVRGFHGRLPDEPDDSPVLLGSSPQAVRVQCAATAVKGILLQLAGPGPQVPA